MEAGILLRSYPIPKETGILQELLPLLRQSERDFNDFAFSCSVPVSDEQMKVVFWTLKEDFDEVVWGMRGIATSCAGIDTTTTPIPEPPEFENINQSKYRENLAGVLLHKRDAGRNTLLHLAISSIARSAKKTNGLCIIIII
jgi:hypothetical protein